jgi:hypothetical protein
MKTLKAYKVFDPDWKCKGFQYEVGKSYSIKDNPVMCEKGFHACKKVSDCFSYCSFYPNNKVAEVELGGVILGEDDVKQCAQRITIIREISWNEMLSLANTGNGNSGNGNSGDGNSGDRNSGYRNSGNRNSGDRNSGYGNAGYRNSGYRNSGDGNSGNGNSGYGNSGNRNSGDGNSGDFNSITPNTILVFNKECEREVWDNAPKPNFIDNVNIDTWVSWSNMTDDEKKSNKDAFVTDGYLKTVSYKEAWTIAYKDASKEEIKLLKALPNFNADVFEEITGIRVK